MFALKSRFEIEFNVPNSIEQEHSIQSSFTVKVDVLEFDRTRVFNIIEFFMLKINML